MDRNTNQSASEEEYLKEFLEVRDKNFKRLMQNRSIIREDFEHRMKKLEVERDEELQRNYAQLQQLGMPEDQMPLPPENEEQRQRRIAHGKPRKLTETEIKRVLQELMEPKKLYTASQLIGFLQICYKDFSEFYQKHGHNNSAKNPPFLFGKNDFRWREYKLWEPSDVES